jgi:CBS domain containing-hemolysin-like protein
VLEERYTRVLIYEGTIDKILGIVHLKDLVKLLSSDGRGDVTGILKPVLRVPGRKPILRLLADMQRGFVHVAVVKDEFGVTLGCHAGGHPRGAGGRDPRRVRPRGAAHDP